MSDYSERWPQEGESWNEEAAIQLMQEAGAAVVVYEESGARMPGREQYHARIEGAHRSKNMEAYREAINGYAAAAREAHRRKVQQESRSRDT